MLTLVDGLRRGLHREYDARLAEDALGEFWKTLNGGRDSYIRELRHFVTGVYNLALHGQDGKRFFVDKTPRYYLIIPQLAELLPAARFVILLRNPLAVFTSVLTRWAVPPTALKERYHPVRRDLIDAPRLLYEAIRNLDAHITVIHYEVLAQNPEPALKKLCSSLGITYEPSMIAYAEAKLPRWKFGDQSEVYSRPSLEPSLVDRWERTIWQHGLVDAAEEYLDSLDRSVLEGLGYPKEMLVGTLSNIKSRKQVP